MAKRISLFLLLILSFVSFGRITTNEVAAAELETVNIHLHKLVYEFGEYPAEPVANTGQVIDEWTDPEPLADVEFGVYDVTDAYYAALATGDEDSAIEAVRGDPTETMVPITTATTDFMGTAVFELAAMSSGNHAVYLFHEEARPRGIIQGSTNLVIRLPISDPISGEQLSVLHLYPKNERAPQLPDTGGEEDPDPEPDPEPEKPTVPIARPEPAPERPVLKLPFTGEWSSLGSTIVGLLSITTAGYILLKGGKKEEN